MKQAIEVPVVTRESGLRLVWDEGFEIATRIEGGYVVLEANPAGLRSLARHLLTLAQDGVRPGSHVHLDDSNALQDGSVPLTLVRAAAAQARSKRPRYFVVGGRPVQVVATPEGGMDVLALDWATGTFVREMAYLERVMLGDAEVDELDEAAFLAEVARIRAERGLPNGE